MRDCIVDEVYDRAAGFIAEAEAAGEEDPDPNEFVDMPDHVTLSTNAKERALQDFARTLRLQTLEGKSFAEEELRGIFIEHGVPVSLHNALIRMVGAGSTDSTGRGNERKDTWVDVRRRVRQKQLDKRQEIAVYEKQLQVLARGSSSTSTSSTSGTGSNEGGAGAGAEGHETAEGGAAGADEIREVVFPAALSKDQRAMLHSLAEELGLGHGSQQIGNNRHFVAWRLEYESSSESGGESDDGYGDEDMPPPEWMLEPA
jgi:hypothetical protein